ncbi:MAG: hypothetical protein IJV04_00970 [Lachnospiraceae bacterium]|nr:hypothetical protein [Lachnospiraceae bacterium]
MDRLAMAANQRRRCSKCHTLMKYLSLGEFKCPACGNEELDDYGRIRKYLDDHGNATSLDIENATGVRRAVINEYLKKGRLEITDGSSVFLKCEKCGKNIKFGRVCPACAKNFVSHMEESILPEEVGEEPVPLSEKRIPAKMRFSDHKKR